MEELAFSVPQTGVRTRSLLHYSLRVSRNICFCRFGYAMKSRCIAYCFTAAYAILVEILKCCNGSIIRRIRCTRDEIFPGEKDDQNIMISIDWIEATRNEEHGASTRNCRCASAVRLLRCSWKRIVSSLSSECTLAIPNAWKAFASNHIACPSWNMRR